MRPHRNRFTAAPAHGAGHARTATHTCIRNGTAALFAAPDIATGAVIGKCCRRHRAPAFPDFLEQIDAAMPEGHKVHPVMDNHATRKTPRIRGWLTRRPHRHVHFTPTSASWINQFERWFAGLTRRQLQRGDSSMLRRAIVRGGPAAEPAASATR